VSGSTPHLGGELFRLAFKARSGARCPSPGCAAIQATIGGHTPIAFTRCRCPFGGTERANCARLALASTERAAGMPDVPTFAETGINDQDADTSPASSAPAGTPKENHDLLYREIAGIVAQPDVKERLTLLAFRPVANTPDQFAARIKLEIEKWGKVVHDAKLR